MIKNNINEARIYLLWVLSTITLVHVGVATVSSCGDNSTPSAIPATDDPSLSTRKQKGSKSDTDKSVLSYPQLVVQYKEKLTVFVSSGQSDSVSFHSLTSAQRKALYEVGGCPIYLHVIVIYMFME